MSNIFIISAPSGCGKTSLVRVLCQTYSFLEQTVSYTTRAIRSGEVDGQDYHFISKDEFIENKKNNKFIESQNVYDNFYGTTYDSINKIGKITFPKLVMHGDKDNIVPFSMGKRMFESFSEPKFSYFKSGDDHMMDFDQELLGNIKNFINELN